MTYTNWAFFCAVAVGVEVSNSFSVCLSESLPRVEIFLILKLRRGFSQLSFVYVLFAFNIFLITYFCVMSSFEPPLDHNTAVCLIFKDRFRSLHISFVYMVWIKSLAWFLVNYLCYPVAPDFVILPCKLTVLNYPSLYLLIYSHSIAVLMIFIYSSFYIRASHDFIQSCYWELFSAALYQSHLMHNSLNVSSKVSMKLKSIALKLKQSQSLSLWPSSKEINYVYNLKTTGN